MMQTNECMAGQYKSYQTFLIHLKFDNENKNMGHKIQIDCITEKKWHFKYFPSCAKPTDPENYLFTRGVFQQEWADVIDRTSHFQLCKASQINLCLIKLLIQ